MATGANTTPLGRLNPAMAGSTKTTIFGQSLLKPSYLSSNSGGSSMAAVSTAAVSLAVSTAMQNSFTTTAPQISSVMPLPKREFQDHDSSSNDSDAGRKKRRKSRWGNDEKEKSFIPGMPTVLPSNLSKTQEKAYLLQLQIEELSRRLRTGELGIPPNPEERSPSPEPIYNNEGKRLNTREYRTRKKLEDERHHLIQQMLDVNPEFKPPSDYKPPVVRVNDKVMIPQEEHPDINFVGLLIGPRGNTLKAMEKETGAKIIIRGKGSVKEGKVSRKDGQPLPGEDEPLHAYVTANNAESVKKAVEKIKEIIRQGVEVPEGQNDLRRMQLRELALLNGTLRENDGPRCTNCGATNHKSWQCPDKPNVTNNVICSSCGSAGHIAKDCRERRPGTNFSSGGAQADKSKIDEEYMSLMAELGEGPPPPVKSNRGESHSSSSSSLFGGQQGQMRAIMAPPPPPPPSSSHNQSQPPALMSQTIQPPWNPNQGKMQSGMNMNSMGGSNSGNMGPQQMQMFSDFVDANGMLSPVSGILAQPPPPPPPPPSGQMPNAPSGMSWMQQQQQGMPWQPHPSPVPPPRPGASAPSHWGHGYLGVPPPPPPQVGQTGTPTMDLTALAQAGLPNLLAAPPPPPPPPS